MTNSKDFAPIDFITFYELKGVSAMLRKFLYGSPFPTEAVINDVPACREALPYLAKALQKDGKIVFSCTMSSDDIVYGLGEAVRGINKRGHIYESFNSDDPYHTEDKRSLYGAHNFLLLSGKQTFGIFVDCPAAVTFDIGYTDYDMLRITPSVSDFALYIIDGSDCKDIVRQFRHAIGQSYIAPKWAFGFQQSRWSYYTADDVRQVVNSYRKHHIPLEAVYLDIDYMEAYKDFTVSHERFPDFPQFVEEMKQQQIHLVPIIDAGVKIEDGYDIYEEGKQLGYFCKKKDGTDFVAGVWPGRTHFPDFLNPQARRWFGKKYEVLLQDGIDGFWNDMNEPAMFYTDEGIAETVEYLQSFDFACNDSNKFFELSGKAGGLANRQKDYEAMYHTINGQSICHKEVHNLFGYQMTRSAGEAFDELSPDKRILLFSRSSYIGMHRYGGIWTGDNQSWWSHLLLNIKMMPSLNMCGFIYCGADLGGFGTNCTRDLLLRWLAFGIFTPLMRNHSAFGTRSQECYSFGDTADFKGIIDLRYRLIPYLYSEYMKACLNDEMLFRPLGFDYPDDDIARRTEDQLLVGESVMTAPVYEPNAVGRFVYLPEDMRFVLFRNAEVVHSEILPKGTHYIHAALNEVPLFIRMNHLLPLCPAAESTADLQEDCFTLLPFDDTKQTVYELYTDDGITKDYSRHRILRLCHE